VGDLDVAEAEFLAEPVVAPRLLDGRQVVALQVLERQ
jgi:hypothetical protein